MQTFWIGTGWKMNMTVAEARSYVSILRQSLPSGADEFSVFLIPPFTALAAAREEIGDAPLLLGAQNMHWADGGAFTGEISGRMLSEFRVDLVELGHSERRLMFGDSDDILNRKIKAALRIGLRPLLCVGDSSDEYRAGASAEAVVRQVKLAFSGIARTDLKKCLIAYEPIWAIGDAGIPATPEYIHHVHSAIHQALAEIGVLGVPVLYGGSVSLDNVAELVAEKTLDGLFIGRAAWEPHRFAAIIRAAIDGRTALTSSLN